MVMDGILNAITGGGLGIIGGLFSKGFHYFERKLDIKEKDAERDHEILLLDKQSQMKVVEAETEMAIASQKYDAQALLDSYKHDASFGQTSKWVANIRSLFRPAVTMSLTILVALIYFFGVSEHDTAAKGQIIDQVLFLCSLTISWWFSGRHYKK